MALTGKWTTDADGKLSMEWHEDEPPGSPFGHAAPTRASSGPQPSISRRSGQRLVRHELCLQR
jgi:hypothetical protein